MKRSSTAVRRQSKGYAGSVAARRFGKDNMEAFPVAQGLRSLDLGDLIRACADGSNARHWEEFARRLQPVIAASVLRATRRVAQTPRDVVDDLVQETFVRLCADGCRVLREFRGTQPEGVLALVRAIAFNTTMDYFRGELALKRGAGQVELPLDVFAESAIPGHDQADATDRQILLEEIDRHFAAYSVRAQDRRMFWLHYRHGITTKGIAALMGEAMTPKGVESTIRRLTLEIRAWLAGSHVKTSHSARKLEGKQTAGSI